MIESVTYFREKAEQCRRLARSILTRDDPAVAALEAMAAEFDLSAALSEARKATAARIGPHRRAAPEQDNAAPFGRIAAS